MMMTMMAMMMTMVTIMPVQISITRWITIITMINLITRMLHMIILMLHRCERTCCLMALASLYSGLILSSLFLWQQQVIYFSRVLIFFSWLYVAVVCYKSKDCLFEYLIKRKSQDMENQLLQTSNTLLSFILL